MITITLTEENLEEAIENIRPNKDNTKVCIYANAAGKAIPECKDPKYDWGCGYERVCFYDLPSYQGADFAYAPVSKGEEERLHSITRKFDTKKYEEIRQMLPLTFNLERITPKDPNW